MTRQKLLAWYDEGVIANGEMVSRLCDLAADHDPVTFAGRVPAELLADIRERTERIPVPEVLLTIRGGTFPKELTPEEQPDREQRERQEKERYVAGLRAWKAYFDTTDRRG